MSVRKRVREFERRGLEVEYSGGGHLKLRRPDGIGGTVYVASTPGSKRAQVNEEARVRRLLRLPRPFPKNSTPLVGIYR